MMNFSNLIFSIIFTLHSFDVSILNDVRDNYNKLSYNKMLCEKMIFELEKTKNNSATYLAYLGGAQTVWANHVVNPISKLNTFNKGKKNIESAIAKEPENVELRFIRLSIQKNAPSFLGYKSNVKEDTELIKKKYQQVNSTILKKNIEALLKD